VKGSSEGERPRRKLSELVDTVASLLESRNPAAVPEGVHHTLPPHLPKTLWTELGDAIKEAERPCASSIAGERFITLRLDGTGFSKFIPRLRKAGLLEAQGYSKTFADIMKECAVTVMKQFKGVCCYTQSDEMTIVIKPASVAGRPPVQQPHMYNGRVSKLTSLAAATATATFCRRLFEVAAELGIDPPSQSELPTFDCRIGSYATGREAIGLLLWRAYDCGVNGVSDAVHHAGKGAEGRKQTMTKGTLEKLQWLAQRGILPLPPHQAHGAFFVQCKRESGEGFNPKTGEATGPTIRSAVEAVPGNLLIRASEAVRGQDDGWGLIALLEFPNPGSVC